MGEILAFKDVTFYYKRKKDKLMILEHADISFEEGKLYTLLGKSGVGKSTTLSLLAGLDEPKERCCTRGRSWRSRDMENIAESVWEWYFKIIAC